jgi:hypothetical protein
MTGETLPPFRANGASLGLEVAPAARFAWRTEVRGFRAHGAVFPDRSARGQSGSGSVVVSSFALTF